MATVDTSAAGAATERSVWKAVALPAEHGGWGLTLEPVLLGLLVAWSVGGLALGIAAFTAFLVRTPLKLVGVDLRRRRWLPRSRAALVVLTGEFIVMVAAVAVAIATAGWQWAVPVLIAAPLVAVELAYDIRSRGRRLVPELCGAVGIASVAASITVAGGGSGRLAAALWLVLAARAVGAIPFVRVMIVRLRRGTAPRWQSDVAQLAAVSMAGAAVVLDPQVAFGAVSVAVLAVVQSVSVRGTTMPAKRLGMRQMVLGLVVVFATAIGVWW